MVPSLPRSRHRCGKEKCRGSSPELPWPLEEPPRSLRPPAASQPPKQPQLQKTSFSTKPKPTQALRLHHHNRHLPLHLMTWPAVLDISATLFPPYTDTMHIRGEERGSTQLYIATKRERERERARNTNRVRPLPCFSHSMVAWTPLDLIQRRHEDPVSEYSAPHRPFWYDVPVGETNIITHEWSWWDAEKRDV